MTTPARMLDRRTLLGAAALTAPALAVGATLGAPAADAASRPALDRALRNRLGARAGSVGVSVYDRRSRALWSLNGAVHNDAASVAKVLILVAVLRRRRRAGTWLSRSEQDLARRMITASDNEAAYALWRAAGAADGVQAMARDLGMTRTSTAPTRAVPGVVTWGRTLTTSDDQLLLLRHLGWGSSHIRTDDRAYVLRLMGAVVSSQRFGVGAVAGGARLKNGWAPRPTHGWRHNSIGFVTRPGRDYALAICTKDNGSDSAGRALCSDLARIVDAQLATPLR